MRAWTAWDVHAAVGEVLWRAAANAQDAPFFGRLMAEYAAQWLTSARARAEAL